jgi:hypothetical protein
MPKGEVESYYDAILKMSFEIKDLVEQETADKVLQQLSEALYCENNELSKQQIDKALSILREFPSLRERVRKLLGHDNLGVSTESEFKRPSGEIMYIEPNAKGQWLICPKDGERVWDYEISAGERRLCLKHRVHFVQEK